MLTSFVAASFLLISFTSRCSALDFSDFPNDAFLDDGGKFHLYWTKLNDTHIEFGMEVQSNGWVAMGISPNGQMPGSDIAFAWVDDNVVYLQDRYTTDRVTPFLDDVQNLYLVAGGKADGVTQIRYIREINPCGSEQDLPIDQGTSRVIFSWNNDNTPDVNDFDNTVEWHDVNKGSKSLNLLYGETFNTTLEADAEAFEFTMNALHVPSNDTTYYCQLFALPKFEDTKHIVRFEPLIQAENLQHVHHFLVFQCPISKVHESNIGMGAPCNEFAQMNTSESQCVGGTVVWMWAVGGGPFNFPQDVGLDLSGGDSDDVLQYVLLEIHYDNPMLLDTLVDSSGVRFWYTSQRRPETASVLNVGLNSYPGQFIPAGMPMAMNSAYCARECTEGGIPEQGTKIISTNLHSHTIGTALRLRQVRNGVELPPVEYNPHYDFNFQQTVPHFEPIVLMPGDELIMDCWYDSTTRTKTTYGGLSTRDEMCMVFMYVYPKVDLMACGSDWSQEKDQLNTWRQGAIEKGYLSESSNYMDDYDVTLPGAVDYYQDLWYGEDYTTRFQYCVTHEQDLIFMADKEIVQISVPYVETNPCDKENNKNGKTEWLGLGVGAWVSVIVAVAVVAVLIAVGIKFCNKSRKAVQKSTEYLSIEAQASNDITAV